MDTPCKQKEFWTTQSLIFLSEVEDVLGSAGGSREAGSQGLTWDHGEVSLCPAQYKSLVTSNPTPDQELNTERAEIYSILATISCPEVSKDH